MFLRKRERSAEAPQRRIERLGRKAYLLSDTLFEMPNRRPIDNDEARNIGRSVLVASVLFVTLVTAIGVSSHDGSVERQNTDIMCSDDSVQVGADVCIEP